MCGLAIQSAVTMGFHLRSDSPSITLASKETRYRLWWALYLLDTLACLITGRMPRMHREHYTTPLPISYQEESFRDEHFEEIMPARQARASLAGSLLSHNSSIDMDQRFKSSFSPHQQLSDDLQPQVNACLCLLFSIDLAAVMREAIDILYSPKATRKSRTEIAQAMKSLNSAADNWFYRLPAEYGFMIPGADNAFTQQRTSLAFQYYSTKLVLSQPAIWFHVGGEDNSNAVHHQMRSICFNAAAQMVDLLPNEPSITWLLSYSPWWSAHHYLSQSTVLLFTQLFIESEMRPDQSIELFKRVQKALQWLSDLSIRDPVFKQALDIFMNLLSSHEYNVVHNNSLP